MAETRRHSAAAAAAWLSRRETWLALLAVPAFLLPEYLAAVLPVSALVLAVLVACRVATRRPLRLGGLLDPIILLLLVLLPVSYIVSSDAARSLPKLTCSLIGIFLFWSMATGLPQRDVRGAGLLLALSGAGLALLGLVGTDWPRSKVMYLSALYTSLPRLFTDLSSATRGRFGPNEVAGALVLMTPLALGALVGVRRARGADERPAQRRAWALALAVTVLLMLAVLALTQARAAIVALLAGLAVMAALRSRRALALGLVAGGGAAAGWAALHGDRVSGALATLAGGAPTLAGKLTALLSAAHLLALSGTGDTASATGRVEMWSNAWRAIWDYPFTGAGLHTFPAVSWANYGYSGISPLWNMTHAHNAYLQVGVDLGVGGLLAFLALVSIIIWRGMRYLRSSPLPLEGWLACGIVGGLVGHLVHSLVDVAARPLGNKPGVIFWLMAGLLLAADRLALPVQSDRPRRVAWPAAALVAASLLAVWSAALGPLAPTLRLNLGALALDQARLRRDVTDDARAALLARADALLQKALPWRVDSVYIRLGLAAAEQNDVSRARDWWARTPQAVPFLMMQSDAALALGRLDRAAAFSDHALALAPASSSVLAHGAAVARARGRVDDAEAMLRGALALDAFADGVVGRSRSLVALARLLASKEQWGEAIAVYGEAQALPVTFTAQREVAAALYRRDGDYRAAEAYLRQSIAQTPAQVQPYVGLMDVLSGDGRVADAIILGQATIRRFPESADPLLLLGRLLFEQERFAEAEEVFFQAVTLRPRLADARIWLARAAFEQKETARAVALLEEGARMAPDQVIYLVWLGDIKRAAGDAAGAAVAYRRALAVDAANGAARRGLESLP